MWQQHFLLKIYHGENVIVIKNRIEPNKVNQST